MGNGEGVAFAGDCSSLLSTSSGLLWTEVGSPRPVFPTALAVAGGMTAIVGVERTVEECWTDSASDVGQYKGSMAHSVTGGVIGLVGTIVGAGTGFTLSHATMATTINRTIAMLSVYLI